MMPLWSASSAPAPRLICTSPVHAHGMGLEELTALAKAHPHARMLDLGCGGGHVSFAAAPHVREVVATDLSPRMLAVVAKAAAEKGLTNLVTRECAVEALPFEDSELRPRHEPGQRPSLG